MHDCDITHALYSTYIGLYCSSWEVFYVCVCSWAIIPLEYLYRVSGNMLVSHSKMISKVGELLHMCKDVELFCPKEPCSNLPWGKSSDLLQIIWALNYSSLYLWFWHTPVIWSWIDLIFISERRKPLARKEKTTPKSQWCTQKDPDLVCSVATLSEGQHFHTASCVLIST